MKKIIPSLPKGTRDYSPDEMKKREYLFEVFKYNFNLYGFNCIETPSMENSEVLNGKYGEEGDRLIYRILNSGDFLKNIDNKKNISSNNLKSQISKKGLRYDLTVPFARYVSMNRDKITMPFKRYQISEVYRNETSKTGRGRYRSFIQADFDQIFAGEVSPQANAEIIQIIQDTLLESKFKEYEKMFQEIIKKYEK